jgi:Fe-S oxidoreductase
MNSWTIWNLSALSGWRTSPGSTSWIFTRAPTAAAARTTARPTPWAGRCPRASSPSRGATWYFNNYPIYPYGSPFKKSEDLIGSIYEEDEIWSCTTCGACEQECPIGIEYIDKIVDLRRGMVDEGMVPQSLQKPLRALEKRGNPWGKMEKKRADWTKDLPEGGDRQRPGQRTGRGALFCGQHHQL